MNPHVGQLDGLDTNFKKTTFRHFHKLKSDVNIIYLLTRYIDKNHQTSQINAREISTYICRRFKRLDTDCRPTFFGHSVFICIQQLIGQELWGSLFALSFTFDFFDIFILFSEKNS